MPDRRLRLCAAAVFGAALLLVSMPGNRASSAEQGDSLLPAENQRPTRYEVEYPAIGYSTVRPSGRIAKLQFELDRGAGALAFDDTNGYLTAVLEALAVDPLSQFRACPLRAPRRHTRRR